MKVRMLLGTAVCLTLLSAARAQAQKAELDYNLDVFRAVAPELITHVERDAIGLPFERVDALAIAADDRMAVAGDAQILVLDSMGAKGVSFPLEGPASCLAFSPTGQLYVGQKQHVAVYDISGGHLGDWSDMGADAILTSILSVSNALVVADAGQHMLFIFDHTGKLTGHVGPELRDGSFVNPGPTFDLAAGESDSFWVANPGRLRMEEFTFAGVMKRRVGRASMKVEGFCGCCNPIHIARGPDGTIVTAEKGLARIKTYSPDGQLIGVVATPAQFESPIPATDLVVDSKGRILVLDPNTKSIRVFEHK